MFGKTMVEFFNNFRVSIRIGGIAHSSGTVHAYLLTCLKFQKTKLSHKKVHNASSVHYLLGNSGYEQHFERNLRWRKLT
jgi:hypothetical protein